MLFMIWSVKWKRDVYKRQSYNQCLARLKHLFLNGKSNMQYFQEKAPNKYFLNWSQIDKAFSHHSCVQSLDVYKRQVTGQATAFATGVPPYIYAFYRYTWNSIALFCTLARQFPKHTTVELLPFTSDLSCHLRTLYAQWFRITLATYVLPRLLARS